MEQYLTFYNNKITISLWNPEMEKWEEIVIKPEEYSISFFLNYVVKFDSKLTIKGFMKQLKPFKYEIDLIFESFSLGHNLDLYYENMEEKSEIVNDDIAYIEFFRIIELEDNEINESNTFQAISKCGDLPYSLRLYQIKNYKNKPFILNTGYEIIDYNKNGEIIVSGNKDFTLYELLSGFIYEITYSGSPENQILETENLIESGELELYSLNELKLDKLREELDKSIIDEDYEKASYLKKEIKKIENHEKDSNSND